MAVAYLAAAGLGKLLAAPPNNTMLLWPAAAVGLVAMARGGARLLPGVGLGGALYTILRLGHDGHLTLEELIGAAENAAVVMLRAWLSLVAFRALLALSPRPVKGVGARILVLVVAGGPLASLPAAFLGTVGLVWSGHVPLGDAWAVAGRWYLADVLGVLVVAPLLLGITSRERLVRVVALAGATLGVVAWWAMSTMELKAMRADLARQTSEIRHTLEYSTLGEAGRVAVAHVDPVGLHILVRDPAGGPPPMLRAAQGTPDADLARRVGDASLVEVVPLRDLELVVAASAAYEARHRSLIPLAALILTWLVAVLFGHHVRFLRLRGHDLAVLVQARTRDLEEARRRAEAASEAKSIFLAHMSHELRTPMNGVIGLASLMMQDDLSEAQRARAEMLDGSARSLLRIVDDILDVARIEEGRMELQAAPLDPRALVRQVLQTVSGVASTSATRLESEVAPEVPPRVVADEKRLLQVLLNLVGNALKFSPGGQVDLRVSWPRAGRLRVEVEDDGVGIPADRQAHVFEPFVQSDASTTRRFGGTGLGLAISRQLVALMGGTLELVSEEGVGSTFSFEIPADPAAAEVLSPAPDEAGAAPAEGLRVLVVEDNRVNQFVARGLLEREGCLVEVAADGAEALARWQAAPFDLVIMDCQMPGMDGFEATRRIRAAEAGFAHVPIVALTAGALDSERDRCFEAGMDDFLTKPLERRELQSALERWGRPEPTSIEAAAG